MKEELKILLIKAKAWILAFLANMWEDCLKDYLAKEIHEIVVETAQFLINFRDSAEYEAKRDEIINNLFGKVKLPFILKPFRGVVKNILITGIQKRIDEKLGKVEEILNK